jgi:hypothetical protein
MMRVLHVFNSNQVAGPEKSVIPGLVELMKLFPEIQFEIVFLEEKRIGANQSKATQFAQSLGLTVTSIEVFRRLDRKAISNLRDFILAGKFDVVHAQDVKATVYSRLATTDMPLRMISTFHGFVRRSIKDKCYELIYFYYASRCDDLVAISKSNFETLKLFSSISRLKLHLIENSIPKPNFRKEEDSLKLLTQLKSPLPPRPWAIMPARFSVEKGHYDLFFALKLLPKEVIFTVWLFGFGPLESELRSLAHQLNIENRIVFGGYLDHAAEYFSSFDYFMMPSHTEGLPIALLEAGWSGLPIIASDIEGIKKVLDQSSLGFFHAINKPDSIVEQILKAQKLNQTEKLELKNKLLNHMEEKFSSKIWCDKMKDLYGTKL